MLRKEAGVEGKRRSDGFSAIEDRYAGYTVYDNSGSKIGKVDDLFLDENDAPEYIGVKMGFLGTRSTLIPMKIATIDETSRAINVSAGNDTVKNGPTFDDDREITPEYEREVLGYYGVDRASTSDSAAYGEYYADEDPPSGSTGRHLALEDLTETQLAALAGRQPMPPAAVGSGLSDVSENHDHYLTGGSDRRPDRESGAG
jgi:hypothetical protein